MREYERERDRDRKAERQIPRRGSRVSSIFPPLSLSLPTTSILHFTTAIISASLHPCLSYPVSLLIAKHPPKSLPLAKTLKSRLRNSDGASCAIRASMLDGGLATSLVLLDNPIQSTVRCAGRVMLFGLKKISLLWPICLLQNPVTIQKASSVYRILTAVSPCGRQRMKTAWMVRTRHDTPITDPWHSDPATELSEWVSFLHQTTCMSILDMA